MSGTRPAEAVVASARAKENQDDAPARRDESLNVH
jgi:hypothetical protein